MKDPYFPDPVAEGRYITGQTCGWLEVIEGAGHYPQTEMSEKTTPIVIDFLNASVIGAKKAANKVNAYGVLLDPGQQQRHKCNEVVPF
jgi:hypothetical protein